MDEEIQTLRDIITDNDKDREKLRRMIEYQNIEIKQAKAWINDLQSGMYINCVYCGHRYGPEGEVPPSMADVLTEHVEQCPKHPLYTARRERDWWRNKLRFELRGSYFSEARVDQVMRQYEQLMEKELKE